MGPRLGSRGNGLGIGCGDEPAPASMGPRLGSRGNAMLYR